MAFLTALETGIAVATLGLIMASLLGGPLSKLLIERNGLTPSPQDYPAGRRATGVGRRADRQDGSSTRAMLAVNVAVILGYLVHSGITSAGGNKVGPTDLCRVSH